MKTPIAWIYLWLLTGAPAFSQDIQLKLVLGTPTPKYGSAFSTQVADVVANGSVRSTREIMPARAGNEEVGAEWIKVSRDQGQAIVFSKDPDNTVNVLALDSEAIAKSCKHPYGTKHINQWLIDSPTRGLLFVVEGSSSPDAADSLLGMTLDSAIPCESSFSPVDATEMKYVNVEGRSGVGDTGTDDSIQVGLKDDGTLVRRWLGGTETHLDYRVPAALFSDMKTRYVVLEINNSQILSLMVTESPDKYRRLVLRKSDQTWHRFDRPSYGRGFGSYLASSEAHLRASPQQESAGKSEWRDHEVPTGPSMVQRLGPELTSAVFPGILHLDDIATGKSFTINTKQGDSEILLVENAVVYYRAANRLYSAPILDTGLGPEKLLATDELIRDAHWAFIKH